MTVATLEELMTDYGAEEVLVGTEVRWVTRDNDLRAVLGPRRHRALPGKLRKRGSGRVQLRSVKEEEVDTIKFKAGGPVNPATGLGVMLDGVAAKPSRWSRAKAAFLDKDLHQAISHAAVDVVLWSVAIFTAVAAVRGVAWLVTL